MTTTHPDSNYVVANSTRKMRHFLPYIHNFRGIAILYIVAFHCHSSFGWGYHDLEKRIWNSLVVYGTVLFVFIAGFLFQHLNGQDRNYDFSFVTYLKKK
jgi:peptidoglycan/LPS O-acetylase OafA/YrhL